MKRNYPTDEELIAAVEALPAHGGNRTTAADSLGLARKTYTDQLKLAERRGLVAKPPASPHPPDGMVPTGVSILSNDEGEIQRWEKFKAEDYRRQELIEETVKAFMEPLKGLHKPFKTPKTETSDCLTNYIIGDAHLGLYAWRPETGDDFDVKIATRDLRAAGDRLIASTPNTKECLIVQLGDFYHLDDNTNRTPASGNQLDVDTRLPNVIRSGIDTLRYMVDRALEKHHTVRIRNVAGNHDPTAVLTLTEALRGFYHANNRVIVEDSPKAFFTHRFGSNLIGITHGHAPKPDKMAGVMAVDSGTDWGECEHKFIWHGHIHHKRMIEDLTCVVESFRTLASKDKWHADSGYRAGREMQAIILHKDWGEIERHTAGIRMVRGH